jgi:hypothetical protein
MAETESLLSIQGGWVNENYTVSSAEVVPREIGLTVLTPGIAG